MKYEEGKNFGKGNGEITNKKWNYEGKIIIWVN